MMTPFLLIHSTCEISTSHVEVAVIASTKVGISARHRCGVASHELFVALISPLLAEVAQVQGLALLHGMHRYGESTQDELPVLLAPFLTPLLHLRVMQQGLQVVPVQLRRLLQLQDLQGGQHGHHLQLAIGYHLHILGRGQSTKAAGSVSEQLGAATHISAHHAHAGQTSLQYRHRQPFCHRALQARAAAR